jgi:hypothetical protein
MLTVGSEGFYEWLVSDQQFDLLQLCPEVVLGLGTSHLGENIFEVPQEQGHLSVLVNYGFALHPPERSNLATLFWPQIARIRPESYVADNDYLTFVSVNKNLFASVRDAVKALG